MSCRLHISKDDFVLLQFWQHENFYWPTRAELDKLYKAAIF